jgi:hypothetical protein
VEQLTKDRIQPGPADHSGSSDPIFRRPPQVGAHSYKLSRLGQADGLVPHAGTLTLIHRRDQPRQATDLLLDQRYLPHSAWRFDPFGALHWRDPETGKGGQLQFDADMASGEGSEFVEGRAVPLAANLPAITYTCQCAVNTGAYVQGTPPALGLIWNTSLPAWINAAWIAGCLDFTYKLDQQIIVGQPFYDFIVTFTDRQTGRKWSPSEGTFNCLVDANFVFHMSCGSATPAPDDRSAQPGGVPTVFPFRLSFQFNATATIIDGAMLTLIDAQNGTVVGLHGVTASSSVVGSYALAGASPGARFAVHDGKLGIAGSFVAGAALQGSQLVWSDLSDDQVKASGLPRSGSATFDEVGHRFLLAGSAGKGQRLGAAAFTAVSDIAATAPAALSLQALTQFTPFVNQNGWYDGVQQAAMQDFNQILLYYMDASLRHTYWNQAQPTLPSDLQEIAAMAPAGEDPGAWYRSLSVAFLTTVLATWDERGADTLNTVRAGKWLTAAVSSSSIYAMQIQALYALEYANRLPSVGLYVADQVAKAAEYASLIEDDAAQWLTQITANVPDPTICASVAAMVQNLSTTALQHDLYWAYAYFRYATAPEQMRALQLLALGQAGDATSYMRRVQSDAMILSALDPENLFANTYLQAVQTQLVASLLPSLADYGNPQNGLADAVELVLQAIAKLYVGDTDKDLASIGDTAATLADRTDLTDLIASMQQAAGQVAQSGGWADAAPVMAQSVDGIIGTQGANLLCTSLAGLAIGGASDGVVDWYAVIHHGGGSGGISASTILSIAQYSAQALYVVVKWGVALSASLNGGPLTFAAMRGLFSTEMLNAANSNIEAGFGRWIVGNRLVEPPSEMFGTLFQDDVVDEQALVVRIFGRNLDDFVGIRMAAIFSIASLVLAAIALHGAETTDEIVQASLMLSASILSLASSAGLWGVQAFGLSEGLATFFSALGYLATIAAVVGIIYTIWRWCQTIPTPVEIFAQTYAQPAGFLMPHGAQIDQFTGYANQSEPSCLGLSMAIPDGSGRVLAVGEGGVASAATFDYGDATLLFVSTDSQGCSALASLGAGTPQLLTDNGDGSAGFAAPLAAGDPNLSRQRWTISLDDTPTMDGDQPSSGSFTIGTANGAALGWADGALTIGGAGDDWVITQQPMALAGLTMSDMNLLTYSQGASVAPALVQQGSTPQTWSASRLPSFLSIDAATGSVSVSPEAPQPLPLTPATSVTISGTNAVPGPTVSAKFQFSVSQPATAG